MSALTVDHRFALGSPALVRAPSKKNQSPASTLRSRRAATHINGGRTRRRAPRSENVRCPTFELGFPRRNLIGVDVGMRRQLSQRLITLGGGKRHLGLESRYVVPARSSAHSLSCSRLSSPLSGRNSTYRPVQICESSSPFACTFHSTSGPRRNRQRDKTCGQE